jgi:hypothetical protein
MARSHDPEQNVIAGIRTCNLRERPEDFCALARAVNRNKRTAQWGAACKVDRGIISAQEQERRRSTARELVRNAAEEDPPGETSATGGHDDEVRAARRAPEGVADFPVIEKQGSN